MSDVRNGMTEAEAERAAREQLHELAEERSWKVTDDDGTGRTVVRSAAGVLLARHLDPAVILEMPQIR